MDVVESYELKHPLKKIIRTSDGEREEEITTVNFRKPLGGDLLAMDKAEGDTGKMFAFISYISDMTVAQLEKTEIVDTRALMKIGNRFLGFGQATGETGSAALSSSGA